MGDNQSICLTAYTRTAEATHKPLKINVYWEPPPLSTQMVSIRVGDVALYLPATDARTLGQGIIDAIHKATQ